ncbi:unnamed protein product [Clavelina lepadiformis]|uniref:glutathione transferase n=1 Tax=Clavelina lepadiformis TaxID=159417 RepID=A0ABP0FJ66_CLALP
MKAVGFRCHRQPALPVFENMTKLILGYWDIRGLAQPIRYMLGYLGVEYEDKRYVEKNSWFDVKLNMNLDFPNIPYIIDGDVRTTQTWAIMKYLARKHTILFPKTEEEIRSCDMLEEVARDLAMPFFMLCYNHDGFDEAKKKYFSETLPKLLDLLEKFLGCSHWMIGVKMTYVDFYFNEVLDVIQLMTSDCLDKHQGIKKYVEKFFALDKIAAYRRSDRFKKWPFMSPQAKWGGKCED